MASGDLAHVCVVRRDLPVGTIAAQLIHAAGRSARGPPDGALDEAHAIALSVPDRHALLSVADRLSDLGIEHVVVHEPDAPYCGEAMAIGVVPTHPSDRRLRHALGRLPLLR